MKIEVSNGEIIDKFTILIIKLQEIDQAQKLKNIRQEHKALEPCVADIYKQCADKNALEILQEELLKINQELWCIEDDIRQCERDKNFGQKFIDLARSVYFTNDRRSVVKKQINQLTGSDLIEEKSYEDYQ